MKRAMAPVSMLVTVTNTIPVYVQGVMMISEDISSKAQNSSGLDGAFGLIIVVSEECPICASTFTSEKHTKHRINKTTFRISFFTKICFRNHNPLKKALQGNSITN